jgi:flagellar basal-body rod protein FlgG
MVAEAAVDTIANNLANVDTAGFKRTLLQVQAQPQRDIYRDQTDPGTTANARTAGVSTSQYVGALGSGSQVYDTPSSFEQGAIASTGNDLDVALSGPGFFATRNAAGAVSYTRDGQFVRDAQGYLTTQSGDRVLSDNGSPIVLPAQGAVSIDRTGTITVGQTQAGKLGITEFANLNALRPQGSNSYVDSGGTAGARPATQTTALQGSLEKSNADVVRSMVDLITNERWFDANQQVIQTQDNTTGQAIQNVGRTSSM